MHDHVPSDLVQKLVSYSIHVIDEYNLSGSKIMCHQILVAMGGRGVRGPWDTFLHVSETLNIQCTISDHSLNPRDRLLCHFRWGRLRGLEINGLFSI